jgi:formate--tetrahydrofolate ligase
MRFVYEDAEPAVGEDATGWRPGSIARPTSPPTPSVLAQIRELAGCRLRCASRVRGQDAVLASPPIRTALGAPEGHVVNVREVRLAAGAEFVVMICGDVMTMPGLPKGPAAEQIDLDAEGRVVGLF